MNAVCDCISHRPTYKKDFLFHISLIFLLRQIKVATVHIDPVLKEILITCDQLVLINKILTSD